VKVRSGRHAHSADAIPIDVTNSRATSGALLARLHHRVSSVFTAAHATICTACHGVGSHVDPAEIE
jgi:hypothetical protein